MHHGWHRPRVIAASLGQLPQRYPQRPAPRATSRVRSTAARVAACQHPAAGALRVLVPRPQRHQPQPTARPEAVPDQPAAVPRRDCWQVEILQRDHASHLIGAPATRWPSVSAAVPAHQKPLRTSESSSGPPRPRPPARLPLRPPGRLADAGRAGSSSGGVLGLAAFTSASTPARIASGRVDHAATTADSSGSVGGDGRLAGAVGVAGGVREPERPRVLPDLLPPDSDTPAFPEENRKCSSPSGGAGRDSAGSQAAPHSTKATGFQRLSRSTSSSRVRGHARCRGGRPARPRGRAATAAATVCPSIPHGCCGGSESGNMMVMSAGLAIVICSRPVQLGSRPA
jgi:hypothetical protein